jgi:proline iminopeptidase
MYAQLQSDLPAARESYIRIANADFYVREIGNGRAIIILHGGPDFDHTYLLPELDHLSTDFRLIYYDQRGRGKSAVNTQPEAVSLRSEMDDLESVRAYFQTETIALLGHSWGVLLALEYAVRYPQRVSHLILLNTAPISHDDYLLLRQSRSINSHEDIEKLKALSATASYQEGDPHAVAAYYRVHFRATVRKPEQLERVVQRLRTSSTKDNILKARAIEKRLLNETWFANEYDLLPRLKQLNIPTLIIHGEYDFVPLDCAVHIAESIPGARLMVLPAVGHFSYFEAPDIVHQAINTFMQGA